MKWAWLGFFVFLFATKGGHLTMFYVGERDEIFQFLELILFYFDGY